MVAYRSGRRRKASLHISLDADLSARLRQVSEKMSIPLSHLSSLALSRAVAAFEAELGIKRELSLPLNEDNTAVAGRQP